VQPWSPWGPLYSSMPSVGSSWKAFGTPAPVAPAKRALVGLAFGMFVRWYEEPALRRQFGAEYEAYIRAVPARWPRLRPWGGGRDVS